MLGRFHKCVVPEINSLRQLAEFAVEVLSESLSDPGVMILSIFLLIGGGESLDRIMDEESSKMILSTGRYLLYKGGKAQVDCLRQGMNRSDCLALIECRSPTLKAILQVYAQLSTAMNVLQ